jgi:chemotaxis protein CheX
VHGFQTFHGLQVKALAAYREVTAFDEISISALQELSNMVAGNGRFQLHDLGVISDITPPSMLMGRGIKATWHRIRAMSLPLQVSQGTVVVTVGLKQGKS